MIYYEKLTVEEALLRALREAPYSIGAIINSYDGDEVTVSFPVTFKVSAKYAKAILKDYLVQELK